MGGAFLCSKNFLCNIVKFFESCECCGFSPIVDACSIRVQQFGGKHGQSWKVAEKLKESDSYVILCVWIEVKFALDVYPMELLGGSFSY
jgi:hypothetical protein